MREIINGKMYNTETAKMLDSYTYSNPGDFNYLYEALYQKQNGEFFLHGEGGAKSIYSVRYGTNEWGGGERLIPYTMEDAKLWMAAHGNVDTYCEVFGEPEE